MVEPLCSMLLRFLSVAAKGVHEETSTLDRRRADRDFFNRFYIGDLE